MDDEFEYIAFVVFEDKTYRYGFNEETVKMLAAESRSPEEAAKRLCPRDDPIEVIIT